jgi:hypothetical protein
LNRNLNGRFGDEKNSLLLQVIEHDVVQQMTEHGIFQQVIEHDVVHLIT